MFSFLNTAILLGLLGVGIPILIHLFARQKLQRIEFSTNRFLKRIQNQTMRRMKLRQMILLILRCLAILFLVLAFARPALKTKGVFGEGRARSSIILIVDRSMSMGRKELFPKARERGSEVLDLLHQEDEASLIWMGDEGMESPAYTHSGDDLSRVLNQSKVSHERGLFFQSIEEGTTLLLNSHNINREIFVISDLQATGFWNSTDSIEINDWEGRMFILPVTGERENVSVVDGGIENQILQPGLPLRVFANIQNCGQRRVEDLLVRVFLRDEVAAQKVINIGAGETQRISFRVLPEEGGWVWGAIRIEDDELPQDNAFFFTCWIPEKIRVLMVGKMSGDIHSLGIALTPQNDQRNNFDVMQMLHTEDWIDQLNEVDVLFFSNFPSFRASEANRLKRFIEEGGGTVFFLGDDVDLRNMNDTFFVPVLGSTFGNVLGSQGEEGGHLSFGAIDFGHPLFSGMFEKGKENIRSPRFFRLVELMGDSPQKIISLSDGRPFLIESLVGKGKVLIATSAIGETWSDLAFSTIFAPIVTSSAAYLSTPVFVEKQGYRVGESISLSTGVEEVDNTNRVEVPSGEEFLLLPELKGGKVNLDLKRTSLPGIYRFYQGETLLGMESVNIDPLESDLEPISKDELEKKFPHAQLEFVGETEDIEPVVSEARWGKEFWREILFLALIMLIVEMLIAREKKKSSVV